MQAVEPSGSSYDDAAMLEVAVVAARAGAVELMKRRNTHTVSKKGVSDLVTDADLASQTVIKKVIGDVFPDHFFVAEEDGQTDPPAAVLDPSIDSAPCWIVDPLDGTVNFVHHLQSFAVSIGCLVGNQLRVGVVLDPVLDQLFTAISGQGAFVNGTPLRSSRLYRDR